MRICILRIVYKVHVYMCKVIVHRVCTSLINQLILQMNPDELTYV